jgi:hypothetical protein
LTIQSWTDDQTNTRYASTPAGCSITNTDFDSVALAIVAYYKNLKNYILENSNLLNTLSGELDSLNTKFATLANDLSNSIDNIDSIITPLFELYKNTIDNNGFEQIINCNNIRF